MRRPWDTGCLALAAPLLLAGLLPLDQDTASRWPATTEWRYPVGDSLDYARGDASETLGYRVNRGVKRDGPRPHQGVDLSNRCAGGPVRAVAAGLVVLAAASDSSTGYGCHVVLAHHLPGGVLAYSVYAHLSPGSLAIRAAEPVAAGDLLGRVGQSGNATSAHLHFEVRLPASPDERWEKAPAVDPIAFVAARLSHAGQSAAGHP